MAIIVNAVIINENKLLTIRRGKEPFKGMYGLPGGQVELNETKEDALKRELIEETNSEIKVGKYLAAIEDLNNIVHLYSAEIINSKQFVPTKEISELKWLDIKEFIANLRDYEVKNWKAVENILLGEQYEE